MRNALFILVPPDFAAAAFDIGENATTKPIQLH